MGDRKRAYQLLCSEPLTDFDNQVLRMLQYLADRGFHPGGGVFVLLDAESDQVTTYYHNASIRDRILAKGCIDLDIQADNIAAAQGGLVLRRREEFKLPLDDEDPDNWPVFGQDDEEDEEDDDAEEADTDGNET